jgi:hypothetical protein
MMGEILPRVINTFCPEKMITLIVGLPQKLYSVPTQFWDSGAIDGDSIPLEAIRVRRSREIWAGEIASAG